jgi:hypothetical protein
VNSSAKPWPKRISISLIAIGCIIVFSFLVGRWFQSTYVGWLIESISQPLQFQQQWQTAVDQSEELTHPAVIHFLPDACACTVLTVKHAKSVTSKAVNSGYEVYQLSSNHQDLGKSIAMGVPEISPIIAITDINGQIQYLGAYSDGVRCTTANSMVDNFVESIENLPKRAIVGLDVEVCRCLESK